MGTTQSSSSQENSGVSSSACPVMKKKPETESTASGCPIMKKNKNEIDPSNQMPAIPNQQPAEDQNQSLSTERVSSTILKPKTGDGEEEATWSYPSPQMFYNALVRKGKAADVREEDMETIVAVHNNMNELAWRDVLRWEALHYTKDSDSDTPSYTPMLSKFLGRPQDLTPKAWLMSNLLGKPKPFDRHDWTVDRNGTEVRYVVDFYYDEEKGEYDETPELHDINAVKSISIDARPALDSFQSVFDRIRMPIMELVGSEPDVSPFLYTPEKDADSSSNAVENKSKELTIADCPIKGTSTKAEPVVEDKPLPTSFENTMVEDMSVFTQQIQQRCAQTFKDLNACNSEEECQKASMGLTFCMASLVCSNEAAALQRDPENESAVENVISCMNRFEERAHFLRNNKPAP